MKSIRVQNFRNIDFCIWPPGVLDLSKKWKNQRKIQISSLKLKKKLIFILHSLRYSEHVFPICGGQICITCKINMSQYNQQCHRHTGNTCISDTVVWQRKKHFSRDLPRSLVIMTIAESASVIILNQCQVGSGPWSPSLYFQGRNCSDYPWTYLVCF